MRIGILALQGAFAEHRDMLESLGADCTEIRQRKDFREDLDALILPGGESTVMKKLLGELGLLNPIRKSIEDGMPVMGTCAGLILLRNHAGYCQAQRLWQTIGKLSDCGGSERSGPVPYDLYTGALYRKSQRGCGNPGRHRREYNGSTLWQPVRAGFSSGAYR